MEKVVPAMPVPSPTEKLLTDLSPQEFQQTLKSWFEEKGLVQDMKTYLKFQMINVLQNTAMGRNLKRTTSCIYSLPQQALHLIVAEYLLHNQCSFALSLFNSEVNLSSIIPNRKLFFETDQMTKEQCRFDKENLVSILELIGLPKDSQHFAKVLQEYFGTSHNSLLSCLLKLMSKVCFGEEEETSKLNEEIEDDFLTNIHQVLNSYNLPHKTQTQLLNHLKVCYDLKNRSYEHQVCELIAKFQSQLKTKDAKLQKMYRRKKCLERKVFKLAQQNQKLQQKLEEKPVDSEKIVEIIHNVPVDCALDHCSEECLVAKKSFEGIMKEIKDLKDVNREKSDNVAKLTIKYNDLLNEFETYLNKINLMNSKLNLNEVIEMQCSSPETGQLSSENSESWTDEVLRRAKQKLKLLEDESRELDVRINQFLIK